jgi:F0F1-type ATP synthase assembly protein I
MFGIGKKKDIRKNLPLQDDVKAKKSKKDKSHKKSKNVNKEPKKQGFNFRSLRKISSLLDGSVLTSDWAIKQAPFFFFLFVLALIYIGNNFVAQSKVKKIDSISKELKDLRDEHISVKSDLMYFTKRSELAKRLKSRGIKEATKPPFKIYKLKKEDK